jgi:uncharacterized protein (TIGR02996 family)
VTTAEPVGLCTPREFADAFAAVARHPADNRARLVFADALHERGDPWGAFVTAQVTRATQVGLGQGLALENNLRAQHAARWVPPGVRPERARFERGFLSSCAWVGATEADHPAWLTVEKLDCFDAVEPQALLSRELPLLRLVRAAGTAAFAALAAGPNGARLETLTLSADWGGVLKGLSTLTTFTSLRCLGVIDAELVFPQFERLCDALGPGVDRLEVRLRQLDLAQVRDFLAARGSRLAVSFQVAAHPTRPSWVDLRHGQFSLRDGASAVDTRPLVRAKLRALGLTDAQVPVGKADPLEP